mgnify:CR=1 FL=1
MGLHFGETKDDRIAREITEANNRGQADSADGTWYIQSVNNTLGMSPEEEEAYWKGHENAERNK